VRTKLEIRDTDNDILGTIDIGKDEDFPFTLTKRLASLNNISKRGGAYSKTFKVPSTKENNQLLHYLYSTNQKVVDGFRERKTANVLVDDIIIERGYVKITDIEVKNKTEYYVMTFFGDNVQWMTDLAETQLPDLDYNYPFASVVYSDTNIANSWSQTYDDGWDIIYPWICYGEYENGTTLTTEDFYPALRYRAIVERALNKVGYNLSSAFMDTADFKQLIFPFVGEKFELSQAVVDDKLFRASFSSSGSVTTYYCDLDTNNLGQQGLVSLLAFDDDSTGDNFDTGGNYDTTNNEYTISKKGKYRFRITLDPYQSSTPNVQLGVFLYKNGSALDTIYPYSIITGKEVRESGYYEFNNGDKVQARIGLLGRPPVIKVTNSTGNFIDGETITGGTTGFQAEVVLNVTARDNLTPTTDQILRLKIKHTGTPDPEFDWFDVAFGPETITGSISGVTGQAAHYYYSQNDYTPDPLSYDYIKFKPFGSYFELIDMNKQILEGEEYVIADVVPDINVLDLFADITKIFNLYWYTDNKTKTIYVEERDSFFQAITTGVDWTKKLAIDKEEKIKFITDYKRDLLFKYAEDSNDKFLAERNEQKVYSNNLYCSYKHTFPDRFPKGQDNLETSVIAPTYIIHDDRAVANPNTTNYGITARMWNESTLGHPPKSLAFQPRILNFQHGTQTIDGDTLYINVDGVNYSNIPSALPIEVFGNSVPYSLSFAQDDGLFKTYYDRTMTIIEDGIQLQAYFDLSPNDYQTLDIRKPIYLNNPEEVQGYWIIDTISDYSPFKPLTKVTLLKYHNQDDTETKIVIDTGWSPPPFPDPTGGDFPQERRQIVSEGTSTDGTTPNGSNPEKMGMVVNNGTGNKAAKGSGSLALGQGCVAKYSNQTFLGSYPEITDDKIAIGVGTENERVTGLRVDSEGDLTLYGGEVYIINTSGERVPVTIESNEKVKKIYLK